MSSKTSNGSILSTGIGPCIVAVKTHEHCPVGDSENLS